jgi:hypothetical protein
MIKVEIKGLDKTLAYLSGAQKQVRFAAAKALTQTAVAVKAEVGRNMPAELDRPKPGTTRALRVEKATRDSLTAVVRLNQRGEGVPAQEFIGHNVTGGRRGMKRSEIMLRRAGILPDGMYTIPGKEAQLDAYGNMSRGQIVSILSYFRTFGATPLNSKRINMTDKTRARRARQRTDYFVVPIRDRKLKLYPGIWQRKGDNTLAPVLMFVRPGTHRKLVKLYETGDKVVKRDFNRLFDAAFADAMRTAR